nr:hypothetical protein [Nocardioides convexus]
MGEGDRVVGYLPNTPDTIVALLAAASIGAVWSVCGMDYAASAALARFEQAGPGRAGARGVVRARGQGARPHRGGRRA